MPEFIDLQACGIDEAQAADLRARLATCLILLALRGERQFPACRLQTDVCR